MNTLQGNLVHVTSSPGAFPPPGLVEIAVMGRSNCGKSTLINTLTGRRKLARTSSTPGRTRQILFFEIDKRFNLVDLPGYGYAQVSKDEREAWKHLVESYLTARKPLVAACLLIDARRKLEQDERDLLMYMERRGVPVLLVLTKVDRFKNTKERNAALKRWREEPAARAQGFVFTSSKTREGVDELRGWVYNHVPMNEAVVEPEPGAGPDSGA